MHAEISKKLITDIINGNKNAFSVIVNTYKNKIFRLCISHLKDPYLAEDTAQEAFIKIYTSLPTFKWKSSFSTWVYSIAYFTCIDKLRKLSRKRADSLDWLREEKQLEIADTREGNMPSRIENTDLIRRVEKEMPAEYMSILHLKFTHDFSLAEITGIMRTSADSVKSKLKRAKKKFIEIYRHFMQD
ncbi:RNA polymerase sigma factor [Spirochaetota bacterium]